MHVTCCSSSSHCCHALLDAAYDGWCIMVAVQYSSWSGDIRTSFKAIVVDLISSSAGRKQETVKVQERFLVRPAEDRLDCVTVMGMLSFSFFRLNV